MHMAVAYGPVKAVHKAKKKKKNEEEEVSSDEDLPSIATNKCSVCYKSTEKVIMHMAFNIYSCSYTMRVCRDEQR